VRISGSVNVGGRIFGAHTTNTAVAPFAAITLFTQSNTQVGFGFAKGSTGNFPATYATITQGLDYVFGLTVTPTTYAFYVNGSLLFSGSGTFASPTWTANALLFLAGGTYFSAGSAAAPVYWGGLWDRALTASEHAAIGASPASIFGMIFRPAADSLVIYPGGTTTTVYFGDLALVLERGLLASLIGESPASSDAGLIRVAAPESSAGPEGSLSLSMAGDATAEAEAWLASLTTSELAVDVAAGSECSMRLAFAGDSGVGRETIPLLTTIAVASVVGLDGASGSEAWTIIVVSSIPRAHWFAPEAARLVPIDRMDSGAFEVDPYAARLVAIAAMDPDSFEVDPFAARVITP